MRHSEEPLQEQYKTRETLGVGSSDPIPRKDQPSGMTYKKHAEAGTQASHAADARIPRLMTWQDICRAWKRPQPRSQISREAPEKFNERVQADILWLDVQPTLHVIDEATRYSQAAFLPSQNEVVMMTMKTLISDEEA
eukprot:5447616-Amphidinium_carterae.3